MAIKMSKTTLNNLKKRECSKVSLSMNTNKGDEIGNSSVITDT